MTIDRRSPCVATALALAVVLALPAGASAQSADSPPKAQRAHTLKPPPRNKVLGGIQRGADATGRGIDRAGDATQRGVNKVSERASRPVRHAGEAVGRKLGLGPGSRAAPPPVGPQGSAP
jgi:hypothetical protein